jgi:hypothetical protein
LPAGETWICAKLGLARIARPRIIRREADQMPEGERLGY